MQRKLYLAFLHAITSHPLPDPLTGYAGTESGLQIFLSASVRSFDFLTADKVELLGQIATLLPMRRFYPSPLMEMQQIGWDRSLPVLLKHPHLRTFAKDIIHEAERMRVLIRTAYLMYPAKKPRTLTVTYGMQFDRLNFESAIMEERYLPRR